MKLENLATLDFEGTFSLLAWTNSLALYHKRRKAKPYSLGLKKPQFRFSTVLTKNRGFRFQYGFRHSTKRLLQQFDGNTNQTHLWIADNIIQKIYKGWNILLSLAFTCRQYIHYYAQLCKHYFSKHLLHAHTHATVVISGDCGEQEYKKNMHFYRAREVTKFTIMPNHAQL